jgi:hypothetical protein
MNPSSGNFVDLNEVVSHAIQQDKHDLVQSAINNGFNNWNLALKDKRSGCQR